MNLKIKICLYLKTEGVCFTPSSHYYKQKLAFYTHLINDVCGLYIDHIHHLINEPKKTTFAYNSDRKEYVVSWKLSCLSKKDLIVFHFQTWHVWIDLFEFIFLHKFCMTRW